MQSGTLEAAVLVWAQPCPPQCCPSVGLCSGSQWAGGPVLALGVRQGFYEDGKGT